MSKTIRKSAAPKKSEATKAGVRKTKQPNLPNSGGNSKGTGNKFLKATKVFIDKSTTERNERINKISLEDFFEGVRSGKWKKQVDTVRQFDKGTDQYAKLKKKVPAVWLQEVDLMVFDDDNPNKKLSIPDRFVLARFKSVGGTGYAVVVRTPNDLSQAQRKWYRESVQRKYDFRDGQQSNDRCRYVSYDTDIVINWGCEVITGIDLDGYNSKSEKDFKDSMSREFLKEAEAGNVMDYTARISMYSHLRHKNLSHDQVVEQLETYKCKNPKNRASRLRDYVKLNSAYKNDYPPIMKMAGQQLKATKRTADIVLDDELVKKLKSEYHNYDTTYEERDRIAAQVVLSPFIPLRVYNPLNDFITPVANSCCLVGPPSSGKHILDAYSCAVAEIIDEDVENVLEKHFCEDPRFIQIDSKDKTHKVVPNVQLVTEPDSSDAAIKESLSTVKTMLVYTQEIGSLIGSLKTAYNKSLLSTLLKATEGESIRRTTKKEIGKTTKTAVKNPICSLFVGGTVDQTCGFFANNIENGLVSRLLFMSIPKGDPRVLRKHKEVNFSDHLDKEQFIDFVVGGYKPITVVDCDHNYVKSLYLKLVDQYEGLNIDNGLHRGMRDCLKRAAVQQWIDGKRDKFFISNDELDWQVGMLIKSLDFAETFQSYSKNNFGESTAGSRLAEEVANRKSSGVEIRSGVKASAKDVEFIRKYIKDNPGVSIKQIAIDFGISRNFIYNKIIVK